MTKRIEKLIKEAKENLQPNKPASAKAIREPIIEALEMIEKLSREVAQLKLKK